MAQDKVGVANLAISRIGGKRISSFSEATAESQAISEVYSDILDEVLAEGAWTFAQKQAALTQLSLTSAFTADALAYIYAEPNDLIKVNFISDASATWKRESMNGQSVIRANIPGLQILYTFRNENPATWFPKFTSAVACRLAYELCFKISEARGYAKDLYEDYHKVKLPTALAADSQMGTPLQAVQNEWESARRMSGAGLFVQPGQQTWHPQW